MPAQPPIRLAIHVGPHKTGSTSVQRALHAARELLAAGGVWYPVSLPGASWPIQHADAWLLLRQGRVDDFDRWLDDCRRQALAAGCDTLLLSSENFHSPRTRRALAAAVARHRRACSGDSRYVYVRREIRDLARSRALSQLAGESGFYCLHGYDLRRWACRFAALQVRHERWFARQGACFLDLAEGPRQTLAARVLEAATDRSFPAILSGDQNATTDRLASAEAILSYGLRVMHHLARGSGVNRPESFAAARAVIGRPSIDMEALTALTEAFRTAVWRDVDLGITDFQRCGPLAREWLIWKAGDLGGAEPPAAWRR